jgi:SAM-dependent methyltransferase
VRSSLEAFLARDENRFRSLFLKAAPLKPDDVERPWMEVLAAAGYVQATSAGTFRPCLRVFFLDDLFIATDLLAHDEEDQVFLLMLEQVFLVRSMDVRKGDHVLELCLGSGANAIAAARRGAARVVGVDINPRALVFAATNAAVNLSQERGEPPLERLRGNLFEPLPAGDRFDFIVVNPPFEPVPPDTGYLPLPRRRGRSRRRPCPAARRARMAASAGRPRCTPVRWAIPTERASELVVAASGLPRRVRRVDRFRSRKSSPIRGSSGYAGWQASSTQKAYGASTSACREGPPGLMLIDAAAGCACDAVVARWTRPWKSSAANDFARRNLVPSPAASSVRRSVWHVCRFIEFA